MKPAPDLILSSLMLPTSAISYHAGRELRALFPESAVVECSACGFDLEGFVEAGHATFAPRSDWAYNQIIATWRGCTADPMGSPRPTDETGIAQKPWNALLRLAWKGKTLDALRLTCVEGMTPQPFWFLIAESQAMAEMFYTEVCEWSAVPHGEVLVFEQARWRKDRALYTAIGNSTFDNLVLAPGLKESLREDLRQFFARREVYAGYRIPWKRGVLLVGPPGNGKTHAVKALCHELGVPALYVRSLEPLGVFHGSEHSSITQVFELARKLAPCILVLEDLDALLKSSNRSFILNELDGFAENAGVCVLATTNFPERLDPSILDRPSRFDRKYHFDLPGPRERASYLKLWNAQQASELQLSAAGIEAVSAKTDGFSFAYLKELCLASTMNWINAGPGASMDLIAKTQAKILRDQMRSAPGQKEETEAPLTPSQRLRKMIQGED